MTKTNPSRRLAFFILTLISIPSFAADFSSASLPQIAIALNSTQDYAQLTLTAFLSAYVIAQLFFGPISDHQGRRPTALLGISVFTVGSIICTLSPNIGILLAGRALQGFGVAAASVSSRGILRDTYCGKRYYRIASYMALTMSLAPITAPALGGEIQALSSWRGPFATILGFAILMVLALFFFLPETSTPEKHNSKLSIPKIFKAYKSVLKETYFTVHILVISLVFATVFMFSATAPFLVQNKLGFSAKEYGSVAMIVGLGYIFGAILNMQLQRFYKPHQILPVVLVSMLAISAIVGIFALDNHLDLFELTIPFFLLFTCTSIVSPNCLAEALRPFKKNIGIASGLYGSAAFAGGALASSILARFPADSMKPLAILLIIHISLAVALYFRFIFAPKAYTNVSEAPINAP